MSRLSFANRHRLQKGVTLTETLLVLALAALLATVAYRAYGTARNDARLADLANGTITLVAKIGQLYGNSTDYTTLNVTVLNNGGVIPGQFRVVGNPVTGMQDSFGNPFEVGGGIGSFAMRFTDLTRENCVALAPALASISHTIRVGAATIGTGESAGRATGGQVYKDPTTPPNVPNLTTGCATDNPALVVEVRS